MRKYSQNCPIARTLDIVGGRWTMLILRDLFFGRTKFREFRESSPGMPPKVLSARLKMLMNEGIVTREIYSEHPLRAQYRLTPKGETLLPVALSIGSWGLANLFEGEPEARAEVARAIYDRIPKARTFIRRGGYLNA